MARIGRIQSLVSLLQDSEMGGYWCGVVRWSDGGMTGQNVENSKLVMIFDETQVILGLFQYDPKYLPIFKSGRITEFSLNFLEFGTGSPCNVCNAHFRGEQISTREFDYHPCSILLFRPFLDTRGILLVQTRNKTS